MKVKNDFIQPLINLLGHLDLPGKESRVRSRMLQQLNEFNNDYQQSLSKILDGYDTTEADTGLKFASKEKAQEFLNEQYELGQEEMIVHEDIVGGFKRLHDYLDDYPGIIKGEDSYAYDKLIKLLDDE